MHLTVAFMSASFVTLAFSNAKIDGCVGSFWRGKKQYHLLIVAVGVGNRKCFSPSLGKNTAL